MRFARVLLLVGFCSEVAAQPAPAKKAPPKGKKIALADIGPDVAALSGADEDAAIKAADALGGSGDPAAHDALLDALAFGTPARVAIAALTALTTHPAPADVLALKRY